MNFFNENTVYRLYTKVYENSRIKGWNIQQNCEKISEKLVQYFFTIKCERHKNSQSRVHSNQKVWKTVLNIQGIDKIQRGII